MKKNITSIALVFILIASVFMAMAPISARETDGDIESGDVIYQGEKGLNIALVFGATSGTLYGIADSTADGEIFSVADATSFNVPATAVPGPYSIVSRETTTADLIIKEPTIGVDVLLGTTSIVDGSVPEGSVLTIRAKPNFGGHMRDASGVPSTVDIKLTSPAGVAQDAIAITASSTEVDYSGDTTGKMLGTWKVRITTDKDTCNDIDISSATVEFEIRSDALTIEAEETEVTQGDDRVITVNGNPMTEYYLAIEDVISGKEPAIDVGTADVMSVGTGDSGTATAAWIKTGSDGIAELTIDTTGADKRTYTIHVWEITDDGVPQPYTFVAPSAVTHKTLGGKDAKVKVKVVSASVTFDVPIKAIIGETVDIKGVISTGDEVDIIIKDEEIVANDEPVDEHKEFSVEWDTDGYTVGSYTIEVYIDKPALGDELSDYDGVDPVEKTTIRLIVPDILASQPRSVIAEGDDYTFGGRASGVGDVDCMLIGPKGWKSGYATASVLAGFLSGAASVAGDRFSEDVTMTEGLDLGVWITLVLSPGRDGEYDNGDTAGNLDVGDLSGKNQEQILELVQELTVDAAGSDDSIVQLSFKVESPYVTLNPAEAVGVGEPLNLTGTTNREPGTLIAVSTFSGPTDLSALTEVVWTAADVGTFTASIDTTDAVEGTYVLEADDGDGHTDSITVTIGAAASSAITATRDISVQTVEPGDTFTVTILITANQTVSAPALDEDLPTGWTVTEVSSGGATFKSDTTEWLWTESLSAGASKTVIYDVTVPSDATDGSYSITGSVSASDVDATTVGGEGTVTVTTDWNPWDDDGVITTTEIQEAVQHWLTDTPINGHLITTAELQEMIEMWLTT